MPEKPEFTCPICGYPHLGEPPYDESGCALFGICPCCGIEFGYQDANRTHEDLRAEWMQKGMPWWKKETKPADFDGLKQLRDAGFLH